MPIAAVPHYLGTDFKEASPGLRFGMYLSLWEPSGWKKSTDNPLKSVTSLTSTDQQAIEGLLARQQSEFDRRADAGDGVRLIARATAPFTTGLGNEHPTENGFAFLNPCGLPYLPGSGVKGVLRQAAHELADGRWGETGGWSTQTIEALFGAEDSNDARRGALSFWDVIPQIAGHKLMVEIMTPHYGHYYQGKSDRPGDNSTTPHDSGQPIPIYFLTVPPESQFMFHVVCNTAFLERLAPELVAAAEDGRPYWQHLLESAFQLAFDWLGFGAKTSVGYGAMRRDLAAEQKLREQAERQQREQAERTRREAALVGLPEDAAELKRNALEGQWHDNHGQLIAGLKAWLEHYPEPGTQAVEIASELMEHGWPGIMHDPDATQGKRNKPKFKDSQRTIAKQLLAAKQRAH